MAKYQQGHISLHVIGFAKVVGDLMDGLRQVLGFFALALAITSAVLLAYTHCLRSTLLVVACSLVAVLWQFGLLRLLGLRARSVLGAGALPRVRHRHEPWRAEDERHPAGRRAAAPTAWWRRATPSAASSWPGLTALLCDAVGFAVLVLIPIRAIQDLAVVASIGVAVLIFTNLVLLPVLLSYVGVSPRAALRSLKQEQQAEPRGAWAWLAQFTRHKPALAAVAAGVGLAVLGFVLSLQLRVGDLDPGAPELRADSRYNRDNAYIVQHYAASTDILTVMVTTPEDQCTRYANLSQVDDLAWRLQQLPGVEGTQSMAGLSKLAMVGYNEGNLKWFELIPSDSATGRRAVARAARAVQPGLLLPVAVRLPEGPQGRDADARGRHGGELHRHAAEVRRAVHARRRFRRH